VLAGCQFQGRSSVMRRRGDGGVDVEEFAPDVDPTTGLGDTVAGDHEPVILAKTEVSFGARANLSATPRCLPSRAVKL
jgi:hypothetical protein